MNSGALSTLRQIRFIGRVIYIFRSRPAQLQNFDKVDKVSECILEFSPRCGVMQLSRGCQLTTSSISRRWATLFGLPNSVFRDLVSERTFHCNLLQKLTNHHNWPLRHIFVGLSASVSFSSIHQATESPHRPIHASKPLFSHLHAVRPPKTAPLRWFLSSS